MKAVNLRELKNRLGGHVREVRTGETILVTDRGTVVAELRPPTTDIRSITAFQSRLEQLAAQGKVRLGGPNRPENYRSPRHHAPAGLADRLIDEDRGE